MAKNVTQATYSIQLITEHVLCSGSTCHDDLGLIKCQLRIILVVSVPGKKYQNDTFVQSLGTMTAFACIMYNV